MTGVDYVTTAWPVRIQTPEVSRQRMVLSGDKLWIYNQQQGIERSAGMDKHWEGPYTIIDDVVYRIQNSPRNKMKVVYVPRCV